MKKISVCMATFNGQSYLKEQIDSILCQLSEHDELIISDDNSTDNTVSIIKSYKDNRIKIFLNKNKSGISQNFQNALEKASGDIIFLSDQDDVWASNKVKEMSKWIEKYDLIVSDCEMVDQNMEQIESSFFCYNKSRGGFFRNFYKGSFYGSCMAFNKDILEKSLPFPKKKKVWHDLWIGEIAEVFGNVLFLPIPLIKYRRHNNATSTTGKANHRALHTKVLTKTTFLYFFSLRYFKLKFS